MNPGNRDHLGMFEFGDGGSALFARPYRAIVCFLAPGPLLIHSPPAR